MSLMNSSVAIRLTAFLLALTGLMVFGVACGKKGPPRPPRQKEPPAITDLDYTINGNILELYWTIPKADDKSPPDLAGFKIFRSKLVDEEAACKDCPIRFSEVGDVPIQVKRIDHPKAKQPHFSELLEPGYRYIYKVVAYNKDRVASKDSNTVQFYY
jgi:hypothetical protein